MVFYILLFYIFDQKKGIASGDRFRTEQGMCEYGVWIDSRENNEMSCVDKNSLSAILFWLAKISWTTLYMYFIVLLDSVNIFFYYQKELESR